MKEFIYQIKLATESSGFFRPTLSRGIIEAEDKAGVVSKVKDMYPEYFDGIKVAQKLTKKSEQLVYVTIYELDEYWSNYWKSEVECVACGKKVKTIDLKNQLETYNTSKFTCSPECESIRKSNYENDYDEYWSSRCDWYFIYKITNKINGQHYIGYTAREPIYRWWEHLKHSDLPIGRALVEFGIESFTFEVLEKHNKKDKTITEMHVIETQYMNKFDSINNGYNCIISSSSINDE